VNDAYHIPALLHETLEYLLMTRDGVYVDGTLGGGGHAEAILEKISTGGKLIGIDADSDAQSEAGRRLHRFESNIVFVHDNVVNLRTILNAQGVSSIRGILLDLGVSSFQLDQGEKGFSYRSNDRLDMRMDKRQVLTAHDVVNSYDDARLAEVLWNYGEEPHSRRIARAVVRRRMERSIDTTGDLAAVIEDVAGAKYRIKTLSRVFQALRIEVNNELENLSHVLSDAVSLLAAGGHIVVLSYHSLEDRIVKRFFIEHAATSAPSGHPLLPDTPLTPDLRLLTRKPVIASAEEQERNPRSRSAKLRAAEKL
jgi:16S rRNA (cytosine1402-N4)-methyltransferase